MLELSKMFEFSQDDLSENNSSRLSESQENRINNAFRQDFHQAFNIAMKLLVMLFSVTIFTYLVAKWLNPQLDTLAFLIATFFPWILALVNMWDYWFGKYSPKYMYARSKWITRTSHEISIIYNISKDLFKFEKGRGFYTHPYYAHWLQSYEWFEYDEITSYGGWYVYDNDNIQLKIAKPQFMAMHEDATYKFYYLLDPHQEAYILSVEEQLLSESLS